MFDKKYILSCLPLKVISCTSNFGSMVDIKLENEKKLNFGVFLTPDAKWSVQSQIYEFDSDSDQIAERFIRAIGGASLVSIDFEYGQLELKFSNGVAVNIKAGDENDDDIVDFFGFSSSAIGFSATRGLVTEM